MSKRIFCAGLLLLLFCGVAKGQQERAWVSTITGNAVKPGRHGAFMHPAPGYALYYAKAADIQQPYLVYVPRAYNPAKPASLVVFLHGAILARDSFQYRDPTIANEPVFAAADALNTIVLFPFGRSDFRWAGHSPAYKNVVQMIAQASERYNIDKQRVYIGGISMGGIATFWYVDHYPDLFAGFYTFSAMPALAGEEVKFNNLTTAKPMYSLHAKDDPGFPYSEVLGIYEQHKAEAPGWHFGAIATGGHRFIYGKGGEQYVKSLLGKLLGQTTR